MGAIDFHAHLVTPAFRAGLAELGMAQRVDLLERVALLG